MSEPPDKLRLRASGRLEFVVRGEQTTEAFLSGAHQRPLSNFHSVDLSTFAVQVKKYSKALLRGRRSRRPSSIRFA